MRRLLPVAAVALLLVSNVPHAVADEIRVSEGSVFYARQDPLHVTFGAPLVGEFFAFGDSETVYPPYPIQWQSGSRIDLSAREPVPAPTGVFSIDGVQYKGTLAYSIAAGSILVPSIEAGGGGVAVAPFRFAGLIVSDAAGATVSLRGRGNVVVNYEGSTFTPGAVDWLSSLYRFENVAVTPEPGTFVLFGTALALLARRYRRNRQGNGG